MKAQSPQRSGKGGHDEEENSLVGSLLSHSGGAALHWEIGPHKDIAGHQTLLMNETGNMHVLAFMCML